ncbi:MAG: histidine phosphatase family protein [Actinobacteria bacterium]|nr:MAG: histidine phosphatase family protein [Actinomycetota bacterium]
MRRRLYLMRHAEVSYFADDGMPFRQQEVALTNRGRQQAEAARAALAGIELDRVVTSGLPRTIETARIVAPGLGAESWAELREWEGGRLADLAEDEVEQAFVGALRVRDEAARFLGGETLQELLDRVLPALERLVAEDWETALAVLHGAVNRVILSRALAGGRAYFGGFEQAPCCINVLDLGDDGWVVRTVNYVPYDPLAPARTTTMEEYWAQYRPAP